MRASKCVFMLLFFAVFLFTGCSDKEQLSVNPVDQSISQPGSIAKSFSREFIGTMYPTSYIGEKFTKYPDGKMISRAILTTIVLNVTYPDGRTDIPDLLSGTGELEFNGSLNPNTGEGYWWGKLTITPSAPEAQGGKWELSWHGKATLTDAGWICPLKELGHGDGGALTGMQCFLENIITAPPDLSSWTGALDGYIKSH